MSQCNILYDWAADGEYFQLYSRGSAKRLVFEIVQRRGYDAYGAANAPIRLTAQSQLPEGQPEPDIQVVAKPQAKRRMGGRIGGVELL